jgi:thymidine kinase
MDLTLIIGPMKSGKSYDLISFFAPLRYTDIPFSLYQSARNVRDEQIKSRNGALLAAEKVFSLSYPLPKEANIVGVDEIHMFSIEDVEVLKKMLVSGVRVVVSGLDLDYRGEMFDTIRAIFELGPKEVRYRRAVCEKCRSPKAVYTQVFREGEPVVSGLPSVIPDDGTYAYKPACHDCFVKV